MIATVRQTKLRPEQVERFGDMLADLKRVQGRLSGRTGARGRPTRPYEITALEPGFTQMLHHVDRAVRWAEEMAWIIERELS